MHSSTSRLENTASLKLPNLVSYNRLYALHAKMCELFFFFKMKLSPLIRHNFSITFHKNISVGMAMFFWCFRNKSTTLSNYGKWILK